jgi:hypothetical protein
MARRTGEITSKAGVASTSKKLATSRHGFDQHPASRKTAGAFAHEEKVRGQRESSRGSTRSSKTQPLSRMKKTP